MYYDLVVNRREGRRIKHERLMYIGKLSGLDSSGREILLIRMEQLLCGQYLHVCRDARLESLAITYVGKLKALESDYAERGIDLSVRGGMLDSDEHASINLSTFRTLESRQSGGSWLVHQILERLGVRDFLLSCGKDATEVDWMLLNLHGRLLHPVSERATANWIEEQSASKELMSEVSGVHGQGLRKSALSWWDIHEELEDYLYGRMDAELDFGTSGYLYDLTNTYFEGRMLGSSLAQRGRSKEKRADAPLVSMGLLTNEDGFIRRSHFYAGNVSEPGTLDDVYDFLEGSPGVVTDAGIGTQANIEELARRGIPYISVARRGFKDFDIDYEQGAYYRHKTSNGESYGLWLQYREHTFEVAGESYTEWLIFVKSEAKQRKEDAMVQKHKSRFEEGLQTIQNSLSKPRGHKSIAQVHQRIGRLRNKYSRVSKAFAVQVQDDTKNVTDLKWTYDPVGEQRNGTYIIRRSEPITDVHQAWRDYCTLTEIEAVNRQCKTDLNLRPVYHQKDHTIQAHLFLTALASNIVQFIRYQLRQQGITWSWKEIVRIMDTQKSQYSEFENKHQQYFLLANWTEPKPKVKQIYDTLQLQYKPHNGFFFKIQKPPE